MKAASRTSSEQRRSPGDRRIRVGIRDLRNDTAGTIRLAGEVGEVIITSNGRDVGRLQALDSEWDELVESVFSDAPRPLDTGLLAELAADDELSTADLG